MSVNCMEELLQFLGCQNPIGEVGFEFIKGQFSIICVDSMNACQQDSSVRAATSYEVKWHFLHNSKQCIKERLVLFWLVSVKVVEEALVSLI